MFIDVNIAHQFKKCLSLVLSAVMWMVSLPRHFFFVVGCFSDIWNRDEMECEWVKVRGGQYHLS